MRIREDVYVRKPYVRKPYISVTLIKMLSEPRKVSEHVSKREVRKYTAPPTQRHLLRQIPYTKRTGVAMMMEVGLTKGGDKVAMEMTEKAQI